MRMAMAKAYIKEAHENDEQDFIYVKEDGDEYFTALRVNGAWEKYGGMTHSYLMSDYHEITDPERVDHLITEAKRSLSVSPVRAK